MVVQVLCWFYRGVLHSWGLGAIAVQVTEVLHEEWQFVAVFRWFSPIQSIPECLWPCLWHFAL